MYMHVLQIRGIKKSAVSYLYEDPPHILDSTIPFGTAKAVTQYLKSLELPGDSCFLCTVSLPHGTDISDQNAIHLMRTALKDRGVEPDAVPYILARHVQTATSHFHLIFVDRTFAGNQVQVDRSIAATQSSDRRLDLALGLEATSYFDPTAMPRLLPPIIKRRVKSRPTDKERRRSPRGVRLKAYNTNALLNLNLDLLEVFRNDQPTGLPALNKGLLRIGSAFQMELTIGKKKGLTYATSGHLPVFLNKLGPAWFKRAINARFAFAAQLALARPVLALRFLLRAKLKNTNKENTDVRTAPESIDPAYNGRKVVGPIKPDRSGGPKPNTATGPANRADQYRRNEFDFPAVPAPGGHFKKPDGLAVTSSGLGPTRAGSVGGGRLIEPRGWIAVLCREARKFGGRVLRLRRHERLGVLVYLRFPDAGVSLHSKFGQKVLKQSDALAAFTRTWTREASKEDMPIQTTTGLTGANDDVARAGTSTSFQSTDRKDGPEM